MKIGTFLYIGPEVKNLLPKALKPEREVAPIGQKRHPEIVKIAKRHYDKDLPLIYVPKEQLDELSWVWLN